MNKKSKLLQERNKCIQERFVAELAKTQEPILSIYATLAVEYDLSVERIREIVCRRRI